MRTIVYTGTRNVYSDMGAAARSAVYNRAADVIYLMIEDDVFPEDLPDNVKTINVADQTYFDPTGPNFASHWTYMVLMKAAAPLMLQGRILVLDIDTIVNGDLDKLWALPSAPIYMAREVGRSYEYYNAGVMLIDCGMFEKDAREVVRVLNCRKFVFIEQDAINEVMRGRIKQLPPEYNASGWTVKPDGAPIITHYAAVRNWQTEALWQKYAGMTWAEAAAGR